MIFRINIGVCNNILNESLPLFLLSCYNNYPSRLNFLTIVGLFMFTEQKFWGAISFYIIYHICIRSFFSILTYLAFSIFLHMYKNHLLLRWGVISLKNQIFSALKHIIQLDWLKYQFGRKILTFSYNPFYTILTFCL